MASKLLWTGLTVAVAVYAWATKDPFAIAGAIVMVIGMFALWLER